MLGRRTHPMIGKLSELFISVNRATFSDTLSTTPSPTGPLDLKIFSQISPRNSSKRIYQSNLGGGVGLGIIAALENSGGFEKFRVPGSNQAQPGSEPIPVSNSKRCPAGDDDEDYTYVTCHRGPDGSYTRVFRDGGECLCRSSKDESDRLFMSGRRSDGFSDTCREFLECSMEVSTPEFQCLDFLNSCYLCKKKLHGQDIYIYRGEKAFCSVECRSSHITMEEHKEKCRSEFSTSPYTPGQIFSPGILVI